MQAPAAAAAEATAVAVAAAAVVAVVVVEEVGAEVFGSALGWRRGVSSCVGDWLVARFMTCQRLSFLGGASVAVDHWVVRSCFLSRAHALNPKP